MINDFLILSIVFFICLGFWGRNDMQVDSTKIEESISMIPILKIPTSTSMSDTEH